MNKQYTVDEPGLLELASKMVSAWKHSGHPGLCILLRGDLGAGKTTFTRGFIQGGGVEGVVKSPTYTLVEPYQVDGRSVYHFDLYRLSDPEELEFTGARDYFNDSSVCLVEWPEKAAGMLPEADLDIVLGVSGNKRKVTIHAGSEAAREMMLALQSD